MPSMSEGAPKENLPLRSGAENFDVFTLRTEHLDLRRIRSLSKELPPVEVPIAELEEQIRAQQWDEELGTGVTPANILDEYRKLQDVSALRAAHPDWTARLERIQSADYSYPVLIYKKVIVDGLHRILHALMNGKETVPAHLFETLPEDAYVPDELLKEWVTGSSAN